MQFVAIIFSSIWTSCSSHFGLRHTASHSCSDIRKPSGNTASGCIWLFLAKLRNHERSLLINVGWQVGNIELRMTQLTKRAFPGRNSPDACLYKIDPHISTNQSEGDVESGWGKLPEKNTPNIQKIRKTKKNSLAFQDKYFKPCRYRTFAHRRLQNQCCSCNSRFPKSYYDSDDQKDWVFA